MRICIHVSICSTHLIGLPNVVPAIFLVLRLDDFQLVLHGTLAEDRALEERHKSEKRYSLQFHPCRYEFDCLLPRQRVFKVIAGNVKVEVGVFGGRVGVGTAASLA